MKKTPLGSIGRRELLARTVPACAMACMGMGSVQGLAGALVAASGQEVHKFDQKMDREISAREITALTLRGMAPVINAMRQEMGDPETIRVLNISSEEVGRQIGQRQAAAVPDTSFENFVSAFRQMISGGDTLTGEVVEDTGKVFELRVTECIWPEVFREAGLDGEVGHAAICNMDYSWPPAFNPAFKMERTKTLMQGHDCCNHRYIDTSKG